MRPETEKLQRGDKNLGSLMVRSTALRPHQERKPKRRSVLMVRRRDWESGPRRGVEMTMNALSFSFPRVCDLLNTSQDSEGYWAPLHFLVMGISSSGAKAAWRLE